MGSITSRKLADGTVRYRAEIRINRRGLPIYKESKTFSSKKLAKTWLVIREGEIEQNPEIVLCKGNKQDYTIKEAINRYLVEVEGLFAKSKLSTLNRIKKYELAKCTLTTLNANDIVEHVKLRKHGIPSLGLIPVSPSTINAELLHLRSVLVHASILWEIDVDLNMFNRVTAQLHKTRMIARNNKRERLFTSDELIRLTLYFKSKWDAEDVRFRWNYPMHLIIWFAIFSCRRGGEITRLRLDDYNEFSHTWLVRDLKNPKGSKGNHKEFLVTEPCSLIIDIAKRPENRDRMLRLGYGSEKLFPLNSALVGQLFKKACVALNINNLVFHDLRHEGCTRLAEQGYTIPQIQQLSLHDSWDSLQIYVSTKKRGGVLQIEDVLKLIGEK